MAAMLSALRAYCNLHSGFFIFKDSWYSFLLEAESLNDVLSQISSVLKLYVFYDIETRDFLKYTASNIKSYFWTLNTSKQFSYASQKICIYYT
jgi:hypothetical protein